MRLVLGRLSEYSRYLEYTIWLVEHGLPILQYDADWKIYVVNFNDEQDAVAFKLRFAL